MKKGHELKIRERLSKSYLQVIFIASISAIVGIIALLVMTRMYNNATFILCHTNGEGREKTICRKIWKNPARTHRII